MNAALLVIDLQKGFLKGDPAYPGLDSTLAELLGEEKDEA